MDDICLSMAEQSIKSFIHNAFFFKFGWCMSPLLKIIPSAYPLALLETWGPAEFSGTKKRGKNLCNWVPGFYLPNTKNYFTVPHRILQGWTQSLPIQRPWGISGNKTWRTEIPYILWKSLTWMKIRCYSLQQYKNCKTNCSWIDD